MGVREFIVVIEYSKITQVFYMSIHLQPVNMFPANSMGFYDVYGNVWEWLEDQFNGLPGFKTHYLYDDFSSPCFDGRHTMMTVSHMTPPLLQC